MAHYQYFVSPKTPQANESLKQLPTAELYDEINNLYWLSDGLKDLKILFNIQFSTQGTGGRNSRQPVDFSVHLRLGKDGVIKELTRPQIEKLLRGRLELKPKYFQAAQL